MTSLKFALTAFTVIIFAVTFGAVASSGLNWPRVFIGDLLAINWRSQFNTDLVIHLGLTGVWVGWREGGGLKGLILGVFCVIWGGMFTFPYVLLAIAKSDGDMAEFFLGVRASRTIAEHSPTGE